jgi:hypothetical protein
VKRRLLQRTGVLVAGFVLSRYIPNRALRRLLLLTVLPAVVAFAFERAQRIRGATHPENTR